VLQFDEGDEIWVGGNLEQGPEILVPAHAQTHIEPDANNAALRLQVREYGGDGTHPAPGSKSLVMQADALDLANPGATDPDAPSFTWEPDHFRRRVLLGQTDLANSDLIDETKGEAGIVAGIISDPAGPVKGGTYSRLNAGCMAFVRELQKKLFSGQPLHAEFSTWWQAKVDYIPGWESPPKTLKLATMKVGKWGDASESTVTRYSILGHNQLQVEFSNQPQGSAETFWDDAPNENGKSIPSLEPWEEQTRPVLTTWNGVNMQDPIKPQGDACHRLCRSRLQQRCSSASTSLEDTGTTELAMMRVNNVTSTLTLVGKEAASAAGAAGVALGAAFVILDFVDGNWIGGGFGAAGLALGSLATAAVGGPIGWLVGGLVTALFAILPGLFKSAKIMPEVDNITHIIQYKMFGDALHTGNEQCQQQNPSCQAVYGPGTLSAVFDWDYFDAIAFLIHFNKGYPMTIPNMAAAFQFNGTVGALAAVDCHNGKWVLVGHSAAAGWDGDNPKWCNHPQFSISRDFTLQGSTKQHPVFSTGSSQLQAVTAN
jgi:hypothetical protein